MNTQPTPQYPRRAPAQPNTPKPLTAYNPQRAFQRARFYLDVLEAHFDRYYEEWERLLEARRESAQQKQ